MDQDTENGRSTWKLGTVSALNLAGFVAELIGGLYFGSLALLSDAFHMVFDSTAYLMAFGSSYIAGSFERKDDWNFGYHRLETLAAFANGALLIPMATFILWKSYQRFLNPMDIGFVPTVIIGSLGLLINSFSVFYLHGDDMSLNEKGAFYHLLGDSGGSIAVIISAFIVHYTGFNFVDPLTAVMIAGFIFWSASKVLRKSTDILLEKSPADNEKIKEEITSLEKVHEIKELRTWSICSQITVASVHICDLSESIEESEKTRDSIRKILKKNGIDHSTIEMEGHGYDGCRHRIEHRN